MDGPLPDGTRDRPSTMRWARIALIVGALLLGAAATLIVWEAASNDSPAPVITGRDT